jgi:hypothetical protein
MQVKNGHPLEINNYNISSKGEYQEMHVKRRHDLQKSSAVAKSDATNNEFRSDECDPSGN